MAMKLVESSIVEVSSGPVDTNGTLQTGDRYNMKFMGKGTWIIAQGPWAAGTPAVVLQQHTAATSGLSKSLTLTRRWSKDALTGTQFVETPVTGDTFTLANSPNDITVVEVDAEQLDSSNGYNYASLNIAAGTAGINVAAVIFIGGDLRYQGQASVHVPDPKV